MLQLKSGNGAEMTFDANTIAIIILQIAIAAFWIIGGAWWWVHRNDPADPRQYEDEAEEREHAIELREWELRRPKRPATMSVRAWLRWQAAKEGHRLDRPQTEGEWANHNAW
jgi:nitrogen fixation-related uncharacterized protein